MCMRTILVCVVLFAGGSGQLVRPDPAKVCTSCEAWNRPRAPYRVFGNTYYVGTAGLSAVLITGGDGHVLLDGALPQSAALIEQNIASLGFRLADVRWIMTSHSHYDHVGGVAALQRASHARVAASAPSAAALRNGMVFEDDPQFALGVDAMSFPPVKDVHVVQDGETIRLSDLAITGHLTPGHTPGGMTWSWQSCESAACRNVVYADSLNAVSADGFLFSRDSSRVDQFRRSIARVESLPCDLLIAVHPGFGGTEGKPDPCRVYAADARDRLTTRLAQEGK